MIQHDPPAFGELAKEQGEFAMRLVVLASQSPAAEDERGVGAEWSDR